MITIKTTPNHEITVGTPFSPALRDACKSLPGGAWDPERRVWVYPATPVIAKEISDRFTGQSPCTDHEFDELVKRGRKGTRLPDGVSIQPMAVVPPDSKRVPWKHQLVAYGNILSRPANLLGHDMGVGKTKPIIDAIVNLPDVNLVLIVCPKSVIDVWPAEFAKDAAHPVNVVPLNSGTVAKRTSKAKLKVQVHEVRQRGGAGGNPEPLVLVINYEAVWLPLFANFALGVAWDMIVCDECHRIKSAKGRASRFLAQLAKVAKRRVGLSGTPMPHSAEDIFAQFRFLDVNIFGPYVTHFRNKYFVMGGYQVNGRCVERVGMKNVDEFYAKVASIAHFVKKEDVLDLPPVIHETRTVTLGADAARVYRDLERDLVTQVEAGLVTVANAMVKVTKLQQVTSGFLRIDKEDTGGEIVDTAIGNEKGAALAELLDDLPPSEPVVVFCRFRYDLDVIVRITEKCGRQCMQLKGGHDELAAWQNAQGGEVLAVQIQTGGVGIDLTRTWYCVYYSVNHNLGLYIQSEGRVHRPGQEHPVTYIHLVTKGTIDETIYKALQDNHNVIKVIIKGITNETQQIPATGLAGGA